MYLSFVQSDLAIQEDIHELQFTVFNDTKNAELSTFHDSRGMTALSKLRSSLKYMLTDLTSKMLIPYSSRSSSVCASQRRPAKLH